MKCSASTGKGTFGFSFFFGGGENEKNHAKRKFPPGTVTAYRSAPAATRVLATGSRGGYASFPFISLICLGGKK